MLPRVLITNLPKGLATQHLNLLLRHRSATNVAVTVTVVTDKSTFSISLNTGSALSIVTTTIPVNETPIAVFIRPTTASLEHGEVWMRLELAIGTSPIAMLAAQYLTSNSPIYWPPGRQMDALGGVSPIVFANPANPGAGNPVNIILTGGEVRDIITICASLQSVGVNTPTATLVGNAAGPTFFQVSSPVAQAAASTVRYTWARGVGAGQVAATPAGDMLLPLPPYAIDDINDIQLQGQDADDVWSDIIVLFHRHIFNF